MEPASFSRVVSVLPVSGPGGGSVPKHFTPRGPTGWLRCALRPAGVAHGQARRRRDKGGAANLARPIKAAARGCAGLGLLGARDLLFRILCSPCRFPARPSPAMLALRCGPRWLGLLSVPRSVPLRLPAARACSKGAGDPSSSSSSGNPLVYLDVGADGQPLGRVVLEVRPLAGPAWARDTGPGRVLGLGRRGAGRAG